VLHSICMFLCLTNAKLQIMLLIRCLCSDAFSTAVVKWIVAGESKLWTVRALCTD
jgi:hypothetical protein